MSDNLISWIHRPIALYPDSDADSGGCFSGSAWVANEQMYLYYTGHDDHRTPKEVQCLATSGDGLTFAKSAANPITAQPPVDGSDDFRDPKVWIHDGLWYMVVGSGRDGTPKVLLYQSVDGIVYECPDVFAIGDSDVLIVSTFHEQVYNVLYFVGHLDYNTGRFFAHHEGTVDSGLR